MTFLLRAFSLHRSTPSGSTRLLRMVVLVGPKYLGDDTPQSSSDKGIGSRGIPVLIKMTQDATNLFAL